MAHELEPSELVGATTAGDIISPLALPFQNKQKAAPRSAPEPPELSLEQYASYLAECIVNPDDTGKVYGRYRVSEPGVREALERAWKGRFEAAPALRAQSEQLVEQFAQWLRSRA